MGARISVAMLQAIELIKQGKTVLQASREAGISRSAIYFHLNKYPVELYPEPAENPVIDLGQDSENKSFIDSYGWQLGIGKTPGF